MLYDISPLPHLARLITMFFNTAFFRLTTFFPKLRKRTITWTSRPCSVSALHNIYWPLKFSPPFRDNFNWTLDHSVSLTPSIPEDWREAANPDFFSRMTGRCLKGKACCASLVSQVQSHSFNLQTGLRSCYCYSLMLMSLHRIEIMPGAWEALHPGPNKVRKRARLSKRQGEAVSS